MYNYLRCAEPGCEKPAFAGGDHCYQHARKAEREKGLALLASESEFRDLSFAGAVLEDINLSGKQFWGCSFMDTRLRSVLFTSCHFSLCFFDRSHIESCDFSHLQAQFCSFGAADLLNVSFESSELVHINFDGIAARECTFSNSNLYDSRFIRCELYNTDMEDCDLKRVYLFPAKEEQVSYKYSNTMEAIRDLGHLYQ